MNGKLNGLRNDMRNSSAPYGSCQIQLPSSSESQAIVSEFIESLQGQQYLQDLSNVIDDHDFPCEPVGQPPSGCYTPPDSVASQTDSPHGMQVEPAVIDYPRNNTNFDCSPIIASNPGPLPPPLSGLQNGAAPTGSATELPQSTALGAAVSSVQPTGSLGNAMTGQHRPQVTSSRCSRAVIEIVNPREEYDKIQKKHGHRGKYSEQRITNGMVEMRIRAHMQLSVIEVYVQRDHRAEEKLTKKDPSLYGVGPTRFENPIIQEDLSDVPTYTVKFDLDSLYRTPDNKEIYRLERTKGTEYNRFWIRVRLVFIDGTYVHHDPYEFVLKSAKTIKPSNPTSRSPHPRISENRVSTPESPPQVPPDAPQTTRFMCQYLEAEFSRIKTLEVEQILTRNHDIAYYIKRKDPDGIPFDEGDVVGFFANDKGEAVIDLLTSENARQARLAGVISRSAYLKAHTGRCQSETRDADLVCIMGEIEVKVVGKVRTGELIYTCPSAKFPGTATAKREQGMFRQTLLGYAMGETSGPGVSKVNCIVSLVLSMNSEERLRELTQVFRSINEVRESMEVHIDYVGHRITRMQQGWRGMWKILLGISIFLSIVLLVCGLMLFPNSPYIKALCQAGSIPKHTLEFTYYPDKSDEGFPVTGLRFHWVKLKQKLSLKYDGMGEEKYWYFLNKQRCETGGIRKVATWLDPGPTYVRITVFATNFHCDQIWHYSKKNENWTNFKNSTMDLRCET